MFFAGVSLLQDDPFDAVPERSKHEENQEQSEGESQCPPVRRLIDRRIGYIAVDGGQQTDDADEETHQKVRLQPHLLFRQQEPEKVAEQRKQHDDGCGERIGDRRERRSGKTEHQFGLQVEQHGEDEQAGVPLQGFHPPSFLLSEPTPQHGDAVGEADDRFERDDNGHILQSRRVLQVVGQLCLRLQNGVRVGHDDEGAAHRSEQSGLPDPPETEFEHAVDEDEQDEYADD